MQYSNVWISSLAVWILGKGYVSELSRACFYTDIKTSIIKRFHPITFDSISAFCLLPAFFCRSFESTCDSPINMWLLWKDVYSFVLMAFWMKSDCFLLFRWINYRIWFHLSWISIKSLIMSVAFIVESLYSQQFWRNGIALHGFSISRSS